MIRSDCIAAPEIPESGSGSYGRQFFTTNLAMRKARGIIQDRILARDVVRLLRDARTVNEVNDIVHSHAAAFRFVHMEILYEDAALGRSV